MFARSNELEQLEFKLEKIIVIQKHAGKVRKCRVSKIMTVGLKGKHYNDNHC